MKQYKQGYALIVVLWSLVIIGIIFINLVDESQLNSLLVRNSIQKNKFNSAAKDGVMKGISLLINDETKYDAGQDKWNQLIILERPDGIKTKVKIKDIGSKKLNINYTSYKLLSQFNWWSKSIETELQKHQLLSNLPLNQELFNGKYKQVKKQITTYGLFNLNTSRFSSLKKLMQVKEISKIEQTQIINKLNKHRKNSDFINSLNDLPGLVGSKGFCKLKPQLTVRGPLNINLVSRKKLRMILKHEAKKDLGKEELEEVIKEEIKKLIIYRQRKEIKTYQQLYRQGIIATSLLKSIEPYFNTYSSYLLIEVIASQPGRKKEEKIEVIVKKNYQDNNWQIEILNWRQS